MAGALPFNQEEQEFFLKKNEEQEFFSYKKKKNKSFIHAIAACLLEETQRSNGSRKLLVLAVSCYYIRSISDAFYVLMKSSPVE